jgi:hypothetical protein
MGAHEKSMRRLFLLTALLALALAPSAQAQLARSLAPDGGALSLEDGSGMAVVVSRDGGMYGRIARGRIVVTDFRRGGDTEVDLRGCDRRRRVNDLTVVCGGRGLRFQIVDGRWRAGLRGAGIDAAAILDGNVTLAGPRGTFSIDEEDEEPWPHDPQTFMLG